MGVYIEAFIDNNIYENDLNYTVNKLCKLLNKKLCLVKDFNNDEYPENENDYLIVNLWESKSIEEELKSNTYLDIFVKDNKYKLDISMSKSSIQFYGFGWKWYVFEDYLLGNNNIFDEKINEIKHFGKIFNSTEVIIFGDDYYESEIEDKLLNGEYIKEIIKNEDFNIVSEIPIKEDKKIHIFYKKLENKNDFDYYEWITHFPIIKSGHCT